MFLQNSFWLFLWLSLPYALQILPTPFLADINHQFLKFHTLLIQKSTFYTGQPYNTVVSATICPVARSHAGSKGQFASSPSSMLCLTRLYTRFINTISGYYYPSHSFTYATLPTLYCHLLQCCSFHVLIYYCIPRTQDSLQICRSEPLTLYC